MKTIVVRLKETPELEGDNTYPSGTPWYLVPMDQTTLVPHPRIWVSNRLVREGLVLRVPYRIVTFEPRSSKDRYVDCSTSLSRTTDLGSRRDVG